MHEDIENCDLPNKLSNHCIVKLDKKNICFSLIIQNYSGSFKMDPHLWRSYLILSAWEDQQVAASSFCCILEECTVALRLSLLWYVFLFSFVVYYFLITTLFTSRFWDTFWFCFLSSTHCKSSRFTLRREIPNVRQMQYFCWSSFQDGGYINAVVLPSFCAVRWMRQTTGFCSMLSLPPQQLISVIAICLFYGCACSAW